jgi:micrococcal nuclease
MLRAMKVRRFLPLLALLLLPVAAAAVPVPAGAPAPSGSVRVAAVTDGDTLELSDGTTVRLVGLQAPKLPLGRPGFREWPLAQEARRALEAVTLGRTVALRPGTAPVDRWQRRLAHLERDDGLWVQGEMLRLGWARVYTFADNRLLAAEMLALERAARAARRGIWAHPYYALVAPERTPRLLDSFQIVEGLVREASPVKGRVYLNFGPDWKSDFTVLVPARVRRALAKQGADPAALAGRTIRVRGWIRSYNGPLIELTHPEQLELP